jgi:hypothetical protein
MFLDLRFVFPVYQDGKLPIAIRDTDSQLFPLVIDLSLITNYADLARNPCLEGLHLEITTTNRYGSGHLAELGLLVAFLAQVGSCLKELTIDVNGSLTGRAEEGPTAVLSLLEALCSPKFSSLEELCFRTQSSTADAGEDFVRKHLPDLVKRGVLVFRSK